MRRALALTATAAILMVGGLFGVSSASADAPPGTGSYNGQQAYTQGTNGSIEVWGWGGTKWYFLRHYTGGMV